MSLAENIKTTTLTYLTGIDDPNNIPLEGGTIQQDGLISISLDHLLFSSIPLVLLALLSYHLELELESPLIVGSVRTFVQLSLLGLILNPIFDWGVKLWYVVVGYVLFMVILASSEAAGRSQYHFPGMFTSVLAAMILSVGIVCIFAFGMVVKADPLWDPQYVIPICGMLLGNAVSGVSLALDATLTSLVEECREVELLLSFGASIYEASSRLMKEAVRSGAMPQLNSMAIIGLVSIPGMMTGQILGGAPVMQAAKYQILIMYFIGFCAFGNIFAVVFISVRAGFDVSRQSLSTEHFVKRGKKKQCLARTWDCVVYPFQCCFEKKKKRGGVDGDERVVRDASATSDELEMLNDNNNAKFGGNKIRIYTLHNPTKSQFMDDNSPYSLEIKGVTRSVPLDNRGGGGSSSPNISGSLSRTSSSVSASSSTPPPFQSSSSTRSLSKRRRTLFTNLNAQIKKGEVVVVSGPSGAGKSQLLRIISGLTPADDNNEDKHPYLFLNGQDNLSYNMTGWRQKVRYVTQYKVDIPGTPRDFMHRISSLNSWKRGGGGGVGGQQQAEQKEETNAYFNPPTLTEMENTTLHLLQNWGIESPLNALNSEWTSLSGGESQRVILALSLASKPAVLLLDESTSGLDLKTKVEVERTVLEYAGRYGMSVLMSTHDQEQIERIMGFEG